MSGFYRNNVDRRTFLKNSTAVTALSALGSWVGIVEGLAGSTAGKRTVSEIENIWIPMPDGTLLAARAWIPVDAETSPVPAIVEYTPYRKRDGTRIQDEATHPYLASHGYACFRVDVRGNGDSEGIPGDEYARQEQEDGVALIDWLARQPWCTGKVGAFGISWGGISALQLAARKPPALKAIITHCSTDDRYTDDAHYIGGCMVQDMFAWGSIWATQVLAPPDPAIVGERWLDMWKARLERMEFFLGDWLENPHRKDFWKHGSISQDYSAIECAVFTVGGWVDAYSSTIPRMLARLDCPRKGLIGPWSHAYPHVASPGPAIDWLSEALRWWDYWLKDKATGIMEEPMYRVWMQHDVARLGQAEVPGRWVAEDAWPSGRTRVSTHYLNTAGLSATPDAQTEILRTASPQTVGRSAPNWLPFDLTTELPDDQRIDDGRSLTFDSAALDQDLEILGAPVVQLDFSVDRPVAFVAIRLNEVEATGRSKRVTYHVRNLTHRNSHENPEELTPGERYQVRIPLHDCAHRFQAGNRIRVSISTTYWPLIWPSPEPVELVLHTGTSLVELPVRTPRHEDAALPAFGPPFVPQMSATTMVEHPAGLVGPAAGKKLVWNIASQTLTATNEGASGLLRIGDTGTEMASEWREKTHISEEDPTSATLESFRANVYRRAEWDTRQETTLKFHLTRDYFHLSGEVRALHNGEQIFGRQWSKKIQRRLI